MGPQRWQFTIQESALDTFPWFFNEQRQLRKPMVEEVLSQLLTNVAGYCMQLEKTRAGGLHVQGYIELSDEEITFNGLRAGNVLHFFGAACRQTHFERARRNRAANVNYCTKKDTRAEDEQVPLVWFADGWTTDNAEPRSWISTDV